MTRKFTFRTDARLIDALRAEAGARAIPVSVLIRDALRAGIEKHPAASRSAEERAAA